MPGHPDGQNYPIWRGPYFAAAAATHIDSTHPFMAQGLVTNFASLAIEVFCTIAAGVTVTLRWWTDSTKTIQIAQVTWILQQNQVMSVIVPALTNFAELDITTTDVAGGACTTAVAPTNTPVTNYEYQVVNNIISNFNFSVAASAVLVFPMPFIASGKGQFFFQDVNASGKLSFEIGIAGLTGGIIGGLVFNPAPVTQAYGELILPDRPVVLEVINTDGVAAHNAGYQLSSMGR